jgi:hypothetical protein
LAATKKGFRLAQNPLRLPQGSFGWQLQKKGFRLAQNPLRLPQGLFGWQLVFDRFPNNMIRRRLARCGSYRDLDST